MKAVYLKMSFLPFSSYLHAPKYPCYCCLDSDPYSSTQLPTIRLRRLTVGAVSKLRICISNPHALSFCHGRRAPSPSGTLARRRQPVQSRLPASRVSKLFLSIFFLLSKTPARTWPLHRLPRSLPARPLDNLAVSFSRAPYQEAKSIWIKQSRQCFPDPVPFCRLVLQ